MTSLCAEFDEAKYFHSQVMHNFNDNLEDDREYQAFYRFSLKREVKFDRSCFSISVF